MLFYSTSATFGLFLQFVYFSLQSLTHFLSDPSLFFVLILNVLPPFSPPLSRSLLSSLFVLPFGLIVVVMAGVWGAAWVQFHSGLTHTMCTIGAWSINTARPVAMLIPAGPSLALCSPPRSPSVLLSLIRILGSLGPETLGPADTKLILSDVTSQC